ncbi:hypothetical protein LVJ94_02100 [Pendulispora rubella]|uniref:DUF3325 domain-containing protein n=1 Tax=Pendulispora rubella TaxID=2741070 RepID=A0ABZ2LBD3_9BACT
MVDLTAFSWSLLAFSLFHAASKRYPRWQAYLRTAGILFTVASLALWIHGNGAIIGSLLFIFSWVVSGSVFVVSVAMWPRLVWSIALVLPWVSALGLLLQGGHAP